MNSVWLDFLVFEVTALDEIFGGGQYLNPPTHTDALAAVALML